MAGTRWFSFGIRVVTDGVAQKFRQVGSDFHNMTEKERQDVARLTQEVRELAKAEDASNAAHKRAVQSHRDDINANKTALEVHRKNLHAKKATLSALVEENKAQGKIVSSAWKTWDSELKTKLGTASEAEAKYVAQRAKSKESLRQLEVKHAREMGELLEKQTKHETDLRTKTNKHRTLAAEEETRQRNLASDIRSKQARIDQAGQAQDAARLRRTALANEIRELKEGEKARVKGVLQGRRDAANKVRAESLKLEDMQITQAEDLETLAKFKRTTASPERKAAQDALRVRRDQEAEHARLTQRLEANAKRVAEGKSPLFESRTVSKYAARLSSIAEELKILQAPTTESGVTDAVLERVGTFKARRTAQQRARYSAKMAVTPAGTLVAPDAEVAQAIHGKLGQLATLDEQLDLLGRDQRSGGRQVRRLRRSKAEVPQPLLEAEQELETQRATGRSLASQIRGLSATHEAALDTAKAGAASTLATLEKGRDTARSAVKTHGAQQPAKFEDADQERAKKIATLRGEMPAEHRTTARLVQAVEDSRNSPGRRQEIRNLEFELAQRTQALETKRQERQDAISKHLETTAEIRDMRHVRDAIKQHLWGAVQDLTMKFAMVAGAINRFSRYINEAAEFHFKAQGLSTLLGAGRGTGQDIYGEYARMAAYQTEVSPLAAVSRMGDLAAAGYSRSEIGSATESIFNTLLAARGEVTESGAFDLGVSLHRAFGGSGRSMGSLLDTTVAAGNMLPMTVGKAKDALQYATEAGVTNNQSLEELLLMIGTVMPIVGTGSKAGTVTRNAINSLSKPKGMEILAGLGVHPRDEQGRMRPVMDTFMDIADSLKDVQRQDFAGTYKDPFGKKIRPPEKQAALDALKMKMDELEFKLTGQRGGAIFAAIERLPELAKGALRGTIYEGSQYQFKDSRDALAALRLGLEDTTGEARRMADELRKTSFMLGKSFQASVEKFQTSLGTFMLPMRDTLLNLWKTALDGLSSMMNGGSNPKYGQPGGAPVGSSLWGNLLGSGAMYATAVVAVKAVVGVMRSAYMASTLLNPTAIATMARAMGAASAAGRTMSVVEAAAGVSGTGVVATAWASFAAALPKTAGVLSLIGGLLGPISLVAGGLYALHVATKASLDAVTDFSNMLRAQVQLRTEKSLAGIRAILAGLAAGRLQADAKGVIHVTPEEARAIKASPRLVSGTLAQIQQGVAPQEALQKLHDERVAEITKNFPNKGQPLDEALAEWEGQYNRMLSDDQVQAYLESIQTRQAKALPDDKRDIMIGGLERGAQRAVLKREMFQGGEHLKDKGGKVEQLVAQVFQEHPEINTLSEALRVDSGLASRMGDQQRELDLDRQNAGSAHRMLSAVGFFLAGGGDHRTPIERTSGAIPKGMKDINRSDFDKDYNYIPGMPGPHVTGYNMFEKMLSAATDAELRSKPFLQELTHLENIEKNTRNLSKIPGSMVPTGEAGGILTLTLGDVISKIFPSSPTREMKTVP